MFWNLHWTVLKHQTSAFRALESSLMSMRVNPRVANAVVLIASLLLFAASGALAQNSEAPACTLSASSCNPFIKFQANSGDPSRPGDVKIEFFGHDSFRITSPAGLTVLVDPWKNDPTGRFPKWFSAQFPPLRVDVVLSTRAHFDHNAVEAPNALMVLDRLVGQFTLGDVAITGLADIHQCQSMPCPPRNEPGFENTIQIITTGGLRIVIWGDNRAAPDSSLDRSLKNVDVLVLPVDTVLTRSETDEVLKKYDPKAIIPSHYFVEGLTTDAAGLESADGWVNYQEKSHHADVHRLDRPELTLNPAELRGGPRRIYYFDSHFESK